jgi:hypothetical protein
MCYMHVPRNCMSLSRKLSHHRSQGVNEKHKNRKGPARALGISIDAPYSPLYAACHNKIVLPKQSTEAIVDPACPVIVAEEGPRSICPHRCRAIKCCLIFMPSELGLLEPERHPDCSAKERSPIRKVQTFSAPSLRSTSSRSFRYVQPSLACCPHCHGGLCVSKLAESSCARRNRRRQRGILIRASKMHALSWPISCIVIMLQFCLKTSKFPEERHAQRLPQMQLPTTSSQLRVDAKKSSISDERQIQVVISDGG